MESIQYKIKGRFYLSATRRKGCHGNNTGIKLKTKKIYWGEGRGKKKGQRNEENT